MTPLERRATLSSDMNVTPMLDVLLVLLVIFMAAVQARKALDVSLPVPCTGQCQGGDAAIVLEVLPGRNYRLNHAPLPAADLVRRLRATYAGRPDKVLQVAGDRHATYDEVMGAMDAARSAGVSVIAIPPGSLITEPSAAPSSPGRDARTCGNCD